MGITIKYKGLEEGPILVTPEGRSPPVARKDHQVKVRRPTAGDVHLMGGETSLHLDMKKREQERVLEEIRTQVVRLAQRIDALHIPQSDLPSVERTAVEDQPGALAMDADSEATVPARHTIRADIPATSSQVLSKPQNPVARVTLEDGRRSFVLSIDGVDHELSVAVNNTPGRVDTQETFLARLAREIDQVDPRISAGIVRGEKDAYDPAPRSQPRERTLRLEVISTEPDRGTQFALANGSGEAFISGYGLDSAVPGGPARVRMEGSDSLQNSNDLSLDGGQITGTILGATQGVSTTEIVKGAGVFVSELSAVVGKYNQLVSYVDSHADLLRPSLQDRFIRPTQERARLLPEIGLRPTAKGTLRVLNKFADQVAGNFSQVRQIMHAETGWLPALRSKLGQILEMEKDAFASNLDAANSEQARQNALELIGSIGARIINGYY